MQKNLGFVIPTIGTPDPNDGIGMWYLGNTPLGYRATGTIWTIGDDHYWYVDGTKTNYLASIENTEAILLQQQIDAIKAGVDKVGVNKDWPTFSAMLNAGTTDPDTVYFVDNINDGLLGGPVQMTKVEYTAYIAAQGTDQLNTLFYITDYNTGKTNAELDGVSAVQEITVTPGSGITFDGKCYRRGREVTLAGKFSATSFTNPYNGALGTIPGAYVPDAIRAFPATGYGAGYVFGAGMATISTGGVITGITATTGITQIQVNATWLIADTATSTGTQSGAFIFNGKVYQGTSNTGSNVSYDNSTSGLASATLQAAIDELTTWKKKSQKLGLIPKQNNAVSSMSNGVISVPATNGTGIVFFVDSRVKTIRITATGAGFTCQYGYGAFTGSLPTFVTTGADRLSYGVVTGGNSADFTWAGSAGLFFAACQGTVAGTITVEVIDYV